MAHGRCRLAHSLHIFLYLGLRRATTYVTFSQNSPQNLNSFKTLEVNAKHTELVMRFIFIIERIYFSYTMVSRVLLNPILLLLLTGLFNILLLSTLGSHVFCCPEGSTQSPPESSIVEYVAAIRETRIGDGHYVILIKDEATIPEALNCHR